MSKASTKLLKPIKLMLVESEEADAQAFRDAFSGLTDRVQLTMAVGLGEARGQLRDWQPDIVVTSLELPDGKGTDLLVAQTEPLSFPVVVISEKGMAQDAVKAMKAGALDYVVKSPGAFAEMPRIVNRALHEWDDAVQRKRPSRPYSRRPQDVGNSSTLPKSPSSHSTTLAL